ncbi:MAG TPA: nitroreductase [Gammaproteobacteria bacterium]|nr:nitroreductase [Gammaproteobacteria bacterium]
MDIDTALSQRYSARAYRQTAVPPATIRQLLAQAQQAPSWCNTQPWEPVVTATPAATDAFRQALWDHVQAGAMPRPDEPFPARYEAEHDRRRKDCGKALYEAIGIPRADRAGALRQTLQNFRLFEAPHVMLVFCRRSLGFYGGVDCGVYLQSFLLAAQAAGVATVAQAALASYPEVARQHFDVAEDRRLLFGVSFGFADPAAPINGFRTERAGPEQAVRWVD